MLEHEYRQLLRINALMHNVFAPSPTGIKRDADAKCNGIIGHLESFDKFLLDIDQSKFKD